MEVNYPLIIVGLGPAGLTASIYASRYKIKHAIIGLMPGGTIAEAHKVGNFPTYIEITGRELGLKLLEHAKSLNPDIINLEVREIKLKDGIFTLYLNDQKTLTTRSVILATGTHSRKLGLESEKRLAGKGVSYCVTCDGFFYKDKVTAVIGGGNSGVTAALYLADLCKKVYLIQKAPKLTAEPIWIDKIKDHDNIEVILNNTVKEFKGSDRLEAIELEKEHNGNTIIEVQGAFIETGMLPAIPKITPKIQVNRWGYIEVQKDQSTNIPGLFAAGDITDGSNNFRQAITACSEGAIAADSIYKFLN